MDDAEKAWQEYLRGDNLIPTKPQFVFKDGYNAGRESWQAEITKWKEQGKVACELFDECKTLQIEREQLQAKNEKLRGLLEKSLDCVHECHAEIADEIEQALKESENG